MMLESLDEGWVEEGTGLPIVPAPIDVDAVPDAPSIDELGNGELMIIEPTLDEGSGTRAPAGLSTDPAGEEGLDTDVSGLDENIDPFQDMETEQESGDRIDDVMEIPSGPEVRLLDDDLSSFPRRKSFGDYRSIIQASQGNGASTAYAEAVASAAARRGEGHATLEWRSPNGKPGPKLNGIRNAGFNQTSGESKAVGLPKPIHGSTRRRANLRTTEDVSKSIDRRFQDLDALESRDENESPIWGSRFQPQ
jgi:hypothetical protein